jgi:hypothetical protein
MESLVAAVKQESQLSRQRQPQPSKAVPERFIMNASHKHDTEQLLPSMKDKLIMA